MNEFRNICEKLDKKYGNLAQEHLALKVIILYNTFTSIKYLTSFSKAFLRETYEICKDYNLFIFNRSSTLCGIQDTIARGEIN